MDKSFSLIGLSIVLLFATSALAEDPTMDSAAASSAVEALKSSLKGETGFQVDKVHMTGEGVACIKYRVAGDKGQDMHAQAVVESGKVLRSTTRSTEFANAWNGKCAGKKVGAS